MLSELSRQALVDLSKLCCALILMAAWCKHVMCNSAMLCAIVTAWPTYDIASFHLVCTWSVRPKKWSKVKLAQSPWRDDHFDNAFGCSRFANLLAVMLVPSKIHENPWNLDQKCSGTNGAIASHLQHMFHPDWAQYGIEALM